MKRGTLEAKAKPQNWSQALVKVPIEDDRVYRNIIHKANKNKTMYIFKQQVKLKRNYMYIIKVLMTLLVGQYKN